MPSLATWTSRVLDAALLADRDLLVVLDRARGVGDVGLAGAELLEAAAGAGLADRDLDVRVLLVEELGRRLGERVDGRGAVDGDAAREVLLAGRRLLPPLPQLESSSSPQAATPTGEARATSEGDQTGDRVLISVGATLAVRRGPSLLRTCGRVVKSV